MDKNYFFNLFRTAFWNPYIPLLSPISWITTLYTLYTIAIYFKPKLKTIVESKIAILDEYRMTILIILIIITIISAAYTIHIQEKKDSAKSLVKANNQIDQLTFERDLALKQNTQIPNITITPSTELFHVMLEGSGCGIFRRDHQGFPGFPRDLTKDDSVLVFFVRFFVEGKRKVQNIQLQIEGMDNPLIWLPTFNEIQSSFGQYPTPVFFEYKGKIQQGENKIKLVVLSDDKSYSSPQLSFDYDSSADKLIIL